MKYFETSDGYRLRLENGVWTNDDLVFKADEEGHPVDDLGDRLDGDLYENGLPADNCYRIVILNQDNGQYFECPEHQNGTNYYTDLGAITNFAEAEVGGTWHVQVRKDGCWHAVAGDGMVMTSDQATQILLARFPALDQEEIEAYTLGPDDPDAYFAKIANVDELFDDFEQFLSGLPAAETPATPRVGTFTFTLTPEVAVAMAKAFAAYTVEFDRQTNSSAMRNDDAGDYDCVSVEESDFYQSFMAELYPALQSMGNHDAAWTEIEQDPNYKLFRTTLYAEAKRLAKEVK